MKRLFYIFTTVAALTFILSSCDIKIDRSLDIDIDTNGGEGFEFLHFAQPEDAWLVTADDESYSYTITIACTKAKTSDAIYKIKVADSSTGVEGKDYEITDKSVTIKAGEYLGTTTVEVLYGTTGEGFNLDLELDADDALINPSYGKGMSVSVKSDKVTIDWAWLEGEWNAQDYSYYNGANDGDSYKMSIAKVDDTHCVIRNIWGIGGSLDAIVDFAARTITIPGYKFQLTHPTYSADLYFVAVDPENDYYIYDPIDTPVTATMSPAGIVIDNYDFILVGGPYDGYTFAGGLRTTLTK